MEISEAFAKLQEEMGAHGLLDLGWTATLDDAKKRFGVCRMSSKEISLSRPLVDLNPESEVRDTILHEIAHALAWELHKENCGHDHRWQAICREIGARPDTTYDDEVIQPDFPWILYHRETGEVFASYQRKPSRDPSKMWWRGSKAETLGKLAYGLNPKLYPPGQTEEFDRNIVSEFQDEVLAAISQVSQKWGVAMTEHKGSFGKRDFRLALNFTPGEGDTRDLEVRDFEKNGAVFGLTAADYRQRFLHNDKSFLLVAIKPRNSKYPVIGESRDGKRYKFPHTVLETLNRQH